MARPERVYNRHIFKISGRILFLYWMVWRLGQSGDCTDWVILDCLLAMLSLVAHIPPRFVQDGYCNHRGQARHHSTCSLSKLADMEVPEQQPCSSSQGNNNDIIPGAPQCRCIGLAWDFLYLCLATSPESLRFKLQALFATLYDFE
jgi:hypothetical protein